MKPTLVALRGRKKEPKMAFESATLQCARSSTVVDARPLKRCVVCQANHWEVGDRCDHCEENGFTLAAHHGPVCAARREQEMA